MQPFPGGIQTPQLDVQNYRQFGQAAAVPFSLAAAPISGTTLANIAPAGALLLDTLNGNLYQNTGTKASPVWSMISGTTVSNGLTASTTHTLVGALALTATTNVVTTAAVADAVRLGALQVGQYQDIYNNAAAAIAVWPANAGVQIDAAGAGASVVLTNAKRCRYLAVSSTQIVSAQLGAISA
jgi:hypothetical protein